MYISRMPLNLARFSTKQLVGSPYKMHAAVEHAFPPNAVRADEQGRILWRIDYIESDHSTWLYVVSPEKPDFTHLVEQAGWPTASAWETKDYTPLLSRIAVGQQWQFRFRGNTVRKALANQARFSTQSDAHIVGKIQSHITVPHQLEWLLKRTEEHGFVIPQTAEGAAVTVTHRKLEKFKRDGATVTLSTAVFEGALEVIDANRFRHALCHGIGRAKGFGCGLLTVAPLITVES